MPELFFHQISYANAEHLDPGFYVLDNTSNERPDWFEYWPIRKFLLSQPLNEESFYGFFSPKFKEKTNLSATAVRDFVLHQDITTTDVILFSPSIHLSTYHLNVFKYGEAVHPGLLRLATEFFARIEQPTNLNTFVTNSRNEVYSNYLVAKPRFWRAWLSVTERLFEIAESPVDPLGADLRKMTSYRGHHDVQMKIFIMERIATWILARDPGFAVRVRDPFAARSRIYKLPAAIACDALKLAYVKSDRQQQYREVFDFVSQLGRFLSFQIRIGSLFRFKHVRSCVAALSAYWVKAGHS